MPVREADDLPGTKFRRKRCSIFPYNVFWEKPKEAGKRAACGSTAAGRRHLS